MVWETAVLYVVSLTATVVFYLGQLKSSARRPTLQELKDPFSWVIFPGTGGNHLGRKAETKPVILLL